MNNQLVAFEVVACVAVSTPKKESESQAEPLEKLARSLWIYSESGITVLNC